MAMRKIALVSALHRWAARALAVGGEHCVELRPRFRIPGAGPVDLLSVRHVQDHFVVGLWSIQEGPLDEREIDAMARRLHAFEAWYCELMEHAETQGFRSAHRLSVCGNLVGRSVSRSRLVDLLSNCGGALCFWTWRPSTSGGLEISPFYGKAPALAAGRSQLKNLLHHLTWADMEDVQEAPAHAVRDPKRG
jgi:hypothetical protein